jgi:hypothetical protein
MLTLGIALALSPAFARGLSEVDAPIGGDDTHLAGVSISPVDDAAWIVGYDTLAHEIDPVVAVWNGGWTELPAPGGPYPYDLLTDVVAVDGGAWVVGYSGTGDATTYVPIAAWWDGAAWVESAVPAVNYDVHLWHAIDALAVDDAWAVGEAYDGVGQIDQGMAWHWDGAAWTSFAIPAVGDARRLDDVAMIAPDDVWAIGGAAKSARIRPLAIHFDGVTWTSVPLPSDVAQVTAISGSAADDVWAVGYGTIPHGNQLQFVAMTLHWDGVAWTSVGAAQPGKHPAFLNDVVSVSPTEAWAVGRYMVTTPEGVLTSHTLVEGWDGVSWRIVRSESPDAVANELVAVDSLGGDDLVAVGSLGVQFSSQPLVLTP